MSFWIFKVSNIFTFHCCAVCNNNHFSNSQNKITELSKWDPRSPSISLHPGVYYAFPLDSFISVSLRCWQQKCCPLHQPTSGNDSQSEGLSSLNNSYQQEDHLSTLRPWQNGCHSADDILKYISLNENFWILHNISLKYFPWGLFDNMAALVQIMASQQTGNKPISEPMLICCYISSDHQFGLTMIMYHTFIIFIHSICINIVPCTKWTSHRLVQKVELRTNFMEI